MTENLFGLLFLLPLPVWLTMLLFPRSRFTDRLVTASWTFIALAGIHFLLLITSLLTAGAGFVALSAAEFRSTLTSEWGFLAVWSHLLILNLFAGVWIFRDARYWGVKPQLYLLATLFLGPLGLGGYFLTRQRLEKRDPIRSLN